MDVKFSHAENNESIW